MFLYHKWYFTFFEFLFYTFQELGQTKPNQTETNLEFLSFKVSTSIHILVKFSSKVVIANHDLPVIKMLIEFTWPTETVNRVFISRDKFCK